jgi:hypothetical protein
MEMQQPERKKETAMYKTKLIASILLIAAVLFAQVGVVAAAPPSQDTTITGTIQSVVPEKDSNGVITVVVTYTDTNGATQTIRITEDAAVSLGLLQVDETNQPVIDETTGLPLVDETKVGTDVTIDPSAVVPDQPTEEEDINPVADLLASFFGVDGSTVNQLHEDGFGFGLIAQALWMSKNIGQTDGGDTELAGCILDAKKNGTYSECFDFGDEPAPTNWGQFKKAFSEKKNNLGFVASGKGNDETTDPGAAQEHGNGKDKNKDKGNGKEKNNNGHGKP